ncbi:hypothetical protein BU104_12595 [Staphylococcus xylosus]|uniref:Uncharacterized protein n=1 Tax=Staphylococcus xylosus TaxID=1288 RepID=A0AAQ0RWX6_STAXY|nr:hypothetical protein [Staphylococcus xylosus]RIM90965.1 hypothetical protein BU104_12595 [Staphylococcus xylosus]
MEKNIKETDWFEFGLETYLMKAQRLLNIDTGIINSLSKHVTSQIYNKLRRLNIDEEDRINYIHELINISYSLVNDGHFLYQNKRFTIYEYFDKEDLIVMLDPKHTFLFIFATKLQADDENIEHYLNGYIADLRENILNKNQSTEDILDKLIYQLELDTEPDHKKLNKEEEHLIDFDENDDFTNGTLEGNNRGAY